MTSNSGDGSNSENMKLNIKVPKAFIVRVANPTSSSSFIVHAYPQVGELPNEIPLTPDPRQPKMGSATVKRIGSSLLANDGRFHLLNRGITISVHSSRYDEASSMLVLDLPEGDDFDKFGIIDGGHTYKTLVMTLQDIKKKSGDEGVEDRIGSQHVHLEILVRVQEHLADIAEARNFSVSLKPWTLAGYKEQFKWFLDAIGPDRRKHVRISENDEEPVGILELIQVMSAMNNDLFPDGEPTLEAYKNAGKCLDYFIEDQDRYGFKKLCNVAPEVLGMYDHIRRTWKDKYNEKDSTGKGGKLGKSVEADQRKKNRAQMATYYFESPNSPWKGAIDDFPVEKGFAIPAISALRPLLILDENGLYRWYTEPKAFWSKHGGRIVRHIMKASDNVGHNPHVVGRDPQVYNALYAMVRGILVEEFLESQGKTLPF